MPKPRPDSDKEIVAYIKAHPASVDREVAEAFGVKTYVVTNARVRAGIPREAKPLPRNLAEAVEFDKQRFIEDENSLEDKYDFLLKENQKLKDERDAVLRLKEEPRVVPILPEKSTGTSEATAIALASDWHIEEEVRGPEVNELNVYNLGLARRRTTQFFQRFLKLIRMAQKDVSVSNAILALLGDFISGSIHDELMEINQLSPSDAIWEAQNIVIAGIDFLLDHSTLTLTIPCKSGNHGRTTKKVRHATEEGNSLESFMYRNLALHYAGEKRVRFILSDGYHIYQHVYAYTLRFHHGHAINYGGGVGGIYIPVNKAIAQWNKSRHADIDCFGHFHQARDGGNFISNGSLIGHNAYAVSIKADFERPRQQFFLVDKKRGKTIVAPILPD